MGKKSKTPEAPNYAGLLSNQLALNNQMQATNQGVQNLNMVANRANQTGPGGSVSWSQDPSTGQWTQTNSYSPQMQGMMNGLLGGFDNTQVSFGNASQMPQVADYNSLGDMPQQANYGSLAAGPNVVDYSSLGKIPQVGQYSQQATDLYNKLAAPELQQSRDAENARLAAMGLNTGSGTAWENSQRALNDASSRSAMMGAQAGIQQGNTMFNQAMQGYQQGAQNLNNQYAQGMQNRQQGVNELNNLWQQQMAGRQQGVNELNSQYNQGMQNRQQGVGEILQQKSANLGQLGGLMNLANGMTGPQFGSYYQNSLSPQATPDVFGLGGQQYQQNLDVTNARNADRANNMKAVGSVASAAIPALAAAGMF